MFMEEKTNLKMAILTKLIYKFNEMITIHNRFFLMAL